MFDFISEMLENSIGRIILLVLIALLLTCPGIFFSCNRELTNLEKFCAIDVDIAKAGINKTVLQEQFKSDPLNCRINVEQHKRKRFMLVNTEQSNALGKQFVTQLEKLNILWQDKKAQGRCSNILKRLAAVLPKHFTPPEKIYILDTPEVNACCLPDGTVIVFRGLLKEFNDDELAYVIGHELGHGVARHSAEMLSKTMIQELAIDAFLEKDSGLFKITGTYIAAFITNLKYSRTQENEADRLALYFLNKAGFPLDGAITALEKFKANAGENSEWKEIVSTHPHPDKRLKNVNKSITQLQKNPDHVWGGLKDALIEKAKVEAVKYYLERKKTNQLEKNGVKTQEAL